MHDVEKVIALFSKPLPTVGSLINMVEQRGFEFEKDGFWEHQLVQQRHRRPSGRLRVSTAPWPR